MNYPYNPNYQDFYQQKAQDISRAFNPSFPQMPIQPLCVNVSSVDEVRSFRIDPMNTYIFVDEPNNRIYKKRIGSTGAAEILAYSLDNPPTPISNEEKIALLEKRIDDLLNKQVSNE